MKNVPCRTVGRPRKSKNLSKFYGVRLDPETHLKIISMGYSLREFIEEALKRIKK